MPKLRDLARIIRSKNAKPFVLTLDMLFATKEAYDQVAAAPELLPAAIAALYQMPPAAVRVIPYPAARAIKITMHRWVPAGSFDDRDLLGAQQAVPLFDLEISEPRAETSEPALEGAQI